MECYVKYSHIMKKKSTFGIWYFSDYNLLLYIIYLWDLYDYQLGVKLHAWKSLLFFGNENTCLRRYATHPVCKYFSDELLFFPLFSLNTFLIHLLIIFLFKVHDLSLYLTSLTRVRNYSQIRKTKLVHAAAEENVVLHG